uniref:DUF1853 family protein n=1 Tax=Flavobacterium sp. TaxID=239 RepID=UPI00404B41A0
MASKARVLSILASQSLNLSNFGFETFCFSELMVPTLPNIVITEKIRLGHRVEKIVSQLIKASTNYKMLHENLQIKDGNKTIGEIDFIIEEIPTKQVVHLELAYKFYLFDPNLSTITVENWIGSNRNDSLVEKIEKLRNQQFPLLNNPQTKDLVSGVDTTTAKQKLCMLTSLYVPYENKAKLEPIYQKVVKGYYINYEFFRTLNHKDQSFYIPQKKDWGVNPSNNQEWHNFQAIENQIKNAMEENQSVLCWQKNKNVYTEFFIVWW